MAHKASLKATDFQIPGSVEAASEMLYSVGEEWIAGVKLAAEIGEQLGAVHGLMQQLREYKSGIEGRIGALHKFSNRHRHELFPKGSKTAKLPAGKVSFRDAPELVKYSLAVEQIIANIEQLGLASTFLKIEKKIKKQELRNNPDKARSIQGVEISSGGENFYVHPTQILKPIKDGKITVPKLKKLSQSSSSLALWLNFTRV